jgi:peptidoglycan glycosyltransferase
MSCNTAFGEIGMKLGARSLQDYATRFGWNDPNLTVPMPVSPSVTPLPPGQPPDPSLTAYMAIGQYSDGATPLQEAMDAAAIANGGKLMRPYLLNYVQAPDLSTLAKTTPSALSQAVTPQVAGDMAQMMIQVTQNPGGTAYQTAGPPTVGSLVIAGKTGTAENGPNSAGLNDAVFTCFAPASNPKIAVGVIVKGGGFGADAAAPIAVKIIEAYLGIHP